MTDRKILPFEQRETFYSRLLPHSKGLNPIVDNGQDGSADAHTRLVAEETAAHSGQFNLFFESEFLHTPKPKVERIRPLKPWEITGLFRKTAARFESPPQPRWIKREDSGLGTFDRQDALALVMAFDQKMGNNFQGLAPVRDDMQRAPCYLYGRSAQEFSNSPYSGHIYTGGWADAMAHYLKTLADNKPAADLGHIPDIG